MIQYIFSILISIDQFANTLLSPVLNSILKPEYKFGYPDETLSSVFGKNKDKCKLCRIICKLLNIIDKNHCIESIEPDEGNK